MPPKYAKSAKSAHSASTRSSRRSVRTVVSSAASSAASSIKKSVKSIAKGAKALVKKVNCTTAHANDSTPSLRSISDNTDTSSSNSLEDETDEQELSKLQASWRSPVYALYKSKVKVQYEGDRKYHYFECANNRCRHGPHHKPGGVRRYLDSRDRSATGNLINHAKTCRGEDAVAAIMAGKPKDNKQFKDGSIFSAFARLGQKAKTFSHRPHSAQETRANIVRWITESNRPAKIVTDPGFENLMKTGRPTTTLPSPRQVARDVHASFKLCQLKIATLLQDYEGEISLSTDAWTSPNHRAIVAWCINLQHEGVPMSFLLDVKELPESHTGEALALACDEVLVEYRVERKFLGFAGDNASSNDTQTLVLHKSRKNSFDEVNRVRCFNHTIQLAARAILRCFNKSIDEGKEDQSDMPELEALSVCADDDEDLLSEGGEASDDDDEDSEDNNKDENKDNNDNETEDTNEAEDDSVKEAIENVQHALHKIRRFAFAVVHSSTLLLPLWRKICVEEGLSPRLIPRDVSTRWNSTFDMLKMALKYRRAIDTLVADKKTKLRKFELDDDEWEVLGDLAQVLKLFKELTLKFSEEGPGMATVAHVLPAMDKIDDMLSVQRGSHSLNPAVRFALRRAQKLMNKYYSATDQSYAYRIAMVLHPNLKLKYFEKKGWEQEWIDEALSITKAEFYRYVENSKTAEILAEEETRRSQVSSHSSVMDLDIFDFSFGDEDDGDNHELADFLAQPVEKTQVNALAWWWDHRAVYPVLSRMALDYFSIPATSVQVERIFSMGRQLLHFTRNRLSPESIRAFLCLGDWCRKGLVDDKDLVEACSSRKRRMDRIDEDKEDEEGVEVGEEAKKQKRD